MQYHAIYLNSILFTLVENLTNLLLKMCQRANILRISLWISLSSLKEFVIIWPRYRYLKVDTNRTQHAVILSDGNVMFTIEPMTAVLGFEYHTIVLWTLQDISTKTDCKCNTFSSIGVTCQEGEIMIKSLACTRTLTRMSPMKQPILVLRILLSISHECNVHIDTVTTCYVGVTWRVLFSI